MSSQASSQVFARKYRPQGFDEVQGQETAVRILKNALEEKRFHHAYLFAGPRGTGKTTLARILAKAMNCEKGPTPTPCGTCQQCVEITKGSSLCVQEIDGASNTSVDDVRDIRDKIRYLPPGGRYKIYIIDEVHMLSTAAFNALLKTLEEPPPHAVFIFATTEIHKLPATVLSRLIRLDLKPLARTTIVSQLQRIAQKEGVVISENALFHLAREASGGMRDALSLLDQVVSFGGQKIDDAVVEEMLGASSLKFVLSILENVLKRDPTNALLKAHEALSVGIEPKRIAGELLEYARHLLVVKNSQDPTLFDLTTEEIAHLKTLSENFSVSELDYLFVILQKGVTDLLRSAQPHLLLDVLVIRSCHVSELKPLESYTATVSSSLPATPQARIMGEKSQKPPPQPQTYQASVQKTAPIEAPAPEMSWPAFLGFLRSKKPQLHAMIAEGKLVNLSSTAVALHFSPTSLNLALLQDPDREATLKGLLKDYFQKPMALTFETKAPSAAPKAVKSPDAKSVSDSIIDDAIDVFGPETTKIPQKA